MNLTFLDKKLTFWGQKTDRKAENWKIRGLGNVKKQKIGFLEVGKLEKLDFWKLENWKNWIFGRWNIFQGKKL